MLSRLWPPTRYSGGPRCLGGLSGGGR
jgi:hypothetical protein